MQLLYREDNVNPSLKINYKLKFKPSFSKSALLMFVWKKREKTLLGWRPFFPQRLKNQVVITKPLILSTDYSSFLVVLCFICFFLLLCPSGLPATVAVSCISRRCRRHEHPEGNHCKHILHTGIGRAKLGGHRETLHSLLPLQDFQGIFLEGRWLHCHS